MPIYHKTLEPHCPMSLLEELRDTVSALLEVLRAYPDIEGRRDRYLQSAELPPKFRNAARPWPTGVPGREFTVHTLLALLAKAFELPDKPGIDEGMAAFQDNFNTSRCMIVRVSGVNNAQRAAR